MKTFRWVTPMLVSASLILLTYLAGKIAKIEDRLFDQKEEMADIKSDLKVIKYRLKLDGKS